MSRKFSEWDAYIGEEIKTQRLKFSRTQKEIAKVLAITQSTLCKIEKGQGKLWAEQLIVLQMLNFKFPKLKEIKKL